VETQPAPLPRASAGSLPRPARPAPSAAGELRELWRARELLWAFVRNDLRQRYVGSSIGFFWTVVNPLLELVTYTFVFHVLLDVRFQPSGTTAHYVLFLFCGMMAWSGFADGITRATASVTDSAHLLRKMNFPAVVLPAHLVAAAMVSQLFRFFILLLGMLLLGDGVSWHVFLVPVFMLVQAMFTLGLGLFLSTLNVYFRDMGHWVTAGLMIGMFVTPVFYPASAYPRQFLLLLYPNPMAQLVGIYQSLLLDQRLPYANSMLYAVVASVLALVVGASVFAHNRRKFADLV
jgi:lipopolysaccharide transport system permease protein